MSCKLLDGLQGLDAMLASLLVGGLNSSHSTRTVDGAAPGYSSI
jgi:hypothetical protein